MARYLVESGNMNEIVVADDMETALAAAIRQHIYQCELDNDEPGPWGEIASIIEVTDDAEHYYISTTSTLQDVGVAYRRRSGD